MSRKFKNITKENIQKYIHNIIDELESILINYSNIQNLYSPEELDKLKNGKELYKNADEIISSVTDISGCEDLINKLFRIEDSLKEIIFKSWLYEKENGCSFISWLKDNKFDENKKLIFSTFNKDFNNTFCSSDLGIEYDVNAKGFIGANNKDGATIIQDDSTESIFTIGKIDGKCINSYNMSTKIVSPKSVMSSCDNNYKSKHNEVILDGNYVVPIRIICLNNILKNEAEELSNRLNIPVSYLNERQSR